MESLDAISPERLAALNGVLTDIDDTLTTDGRLSADAYQALEALHEAGLLVIPITGRPAGWCDHIARMWPVDAVVGENGAFWMRYEHGARRMRQRFLAGDAERRANRERLTGLAARILEQVPGTAMASDQGYRAADIAIDFCEDVPALPPEAVARIVAIAEGEGATAKVSSIHVNIWYGSYDKLGMSRACLAECFGIDLEATRERFVFTGDSPNDAPMFAWFPLSVGVANVHDFAGRIEHEPAFVASRRGGAGFAELARLILSARNPVAALSR